MQVMKTSAFVDIKWVDTELVTEYTVNELLGDVDGILVPGGFGQRGVEGQRLKQQNMLVRTTMFLTLVFA